MIDKDEIDGRAADLGVHASNVQRDYVFGWVLAGLYQSSNPLAERLSLKGGNAFRNAYFENARYSNDLDFSTEIQLSEDELRGAVGLACDFASGRSDVEFNVADTRIATRETADREGKLYEARVYFKSFYGEEDVVIRIKLDVKEFDRIILPVQTRQLIHSYSDAHLCSTPVRCHKLEELLAAKLVALLHRRHSPDLFDFVQSVFFQTNLEVDRTQIVRTFLKKTIYEPTPSVARGLLLDLPFAVFRRLWQEYLVVPKSVLLAFEDAERGFKSVINELFGLLEPRLAFAGIPSSASTGTYYAGGIRSSILEAGSLRRILRIVYDGYERRVEPYALTFKRRKDGVAHEYFYGWDLSGGSSGQIGIKSFFADKLVSARVTEETFDPKFPIELAKGGTGYFARASFSSTRRSPTGRSAVSPRRTYTVQCPYCNKQFKRSRAGTKLSDHTDRFGNRCYGRVGVIVSVS